MALSKDQSSVKRLRATLSLMQTAVDDIIEAWQEPATEDDEGKNSMATHKAFQGQRVLLSAVGVMTELVTNPASRLMEVSSQYNESRCLHIAASLRFADIFAKSNSGVHVKDLCSSVGIEHRKLARILRCLASNHIFQEAQQDVFSNNAVSAALVDNEPLRAYLMLFGLDPYSSSDALPRTLLDPKKGPSYDVAQTAWQDAVNTTKPRWEWLEECVTEEQLRVQSGSGYPGIFGPDLEESLMALKTSTTVARPELKIFGQAMVGGGRVFGTAHLYDYPWDSLGQAKVVDVGGGVGGFCLQLSHLYPDLSFVLQDRAPAIDQAKSVVWPQSNPSALKNERIVFQPHDFFAPNPVTGADIYWLRYILHDWSDDYCVQILSAIRQSMTHQSKLLIADQVMNTTLGCPEIESAPEPLPANYGTYTRYSHQRDITMMSIINGIERTPAEFQDIIQRAGLALHKIISCRSQVSLIECRLPGEQSNGSLDA